MCFIAMLSTNAPNELIPNDLNSVCFVPYSPKNQELYLQYPNTYQLTTLTPDNCGCGFRIFGDELAQDVGFCPPQDWLNETEHDERIIHTRVLFEFIKSLVIKGFSVDSHVYWLDDLDNEDERIQSEYIIGVQELPAEHFALFEDCRFVYRLSANEYFQPA